MPKRTNCTATSVATNCPIGSPTSTSGSKRSPKPRLSWRRKPRLRPTKSAGSRRRSKQRDAESRTKPGKPGAPPSEEPATKAQRNFTDPDSRILKTKDGFIQGYNAQAAVDGEAQIIVAHGLTPSTSDHGQLVPLLDGIQANLGRKPRQASADSGYLSEANLASLEARGIEAISRPAAPSTRPS